MAEGIEVRHKKACPQHAGGRCACDPSYRPSVWSERDGRRIYPPAPCRSLAEAKRWRSDALVSLRAGRLRAGTAPTLAEAVKAWLKGAEAGTIRKRGRGEFKPGSTRAVETSYRIRLADRFGATRLDRITQLDIQEYIDELDAGDMAPSTIEGTILPLRLVYRWARGRGVVAIDPTDGLELPEKPRGQRTPPAPADAAKLLATVPQEDQALWAGAMLAGLRRGELMALRWEDVDLAAGIVRVERSYDPASGTFGTPKSRHGVRAIPIAGTLAPYLRAHLLLSGRRDGLIFGQNGSRPFSATAVQKRADGAWKTGAPERVTLHECRHLYASMSIVAGVNAHALCKYMGHSSIQVTFDLYGHLFPGNEADAAELLDNYLMTAFA